MGRTGMIRNGDSMLDISRAMHELHNEATEKVTQAAEKLEQHSMNPPDSLTNGEVEDIGEQRGWLVFKSKVVWRNAIAIIIMHVIAVYYLFAVASSSKILTWVWKWILIQIGGFGVTGGVHRYWSHRSYKAKLPLRLILLICFCLSGQSTVINWTRHHRVHHKYTETAADPCDRRRGFWFSHVGWMMMKNRPEVIQYERQIDMSDILADPLAAFHQRYYWQMQILFLWIISTSIPVYCWGEAWSNAFMAILFSNVFTMNLAWCINSVAHTWGQKPFDRKIAATDNGALAFFTLGEGLHNYHHVFPWDYRVSELGDHAFITTTMILNMFAKIGWAYDLKQPSENLVKTTAMKYGDGTFPKWQEIVESKED